ncbi:hypothetical protein Slala03_74240 [Streptomyces lavendulae subsp. lavendulae]|uniref:hypothetical protein n=1 Tax=Streptomyces lavendulae TaxID=1914 RepID=UPI0024A21418|nr:hypothetical protein [Streptomyces lavendulae]GLV87735.1 hypothetical protein Slala03_74240 [Streptomyces lavendulae subsp. lavendulae]
MQVPEHGGTSAAWNTLHPDGQLLRVILSETPVIFQQGLNMVRPQARRSSPALGPKEDRASP